MRASVWTMFFLGMLALAAWVVLGWILRHPDVGGWDEMGYIALAQRDALLLHTEGWGAWRDTIFTYYRWQTPGPRLFGPVLDAFGMLDATNLRLASATLIGAGVVVLWDAARRVAGIAAASVVVAALALMPVMLRAAQNFMGETLLLPAICALLWLLVRELTAPAPRAWTVAGFALVFAMGLLGRFSFVPVLSVVLLSGTVAALIGWIEKRIAWRLWMGLVLAMVVVWPIYAFNLARYLGYARFALTWPLDALPAEGPLDFAAQWSQVLLADVMGPAAAVLIIVGCVLALWGLLRGMARPMAPQTAVAVFALVAAGPILLSHLTGMNQNPRYLAPALPCFALAAAVGVGLLERWWQWVGGVLVVGQAALLALATVSGTPGLWPSGRLSTGFQALTWRPNATCDWGPLLAAAPAGIPRILGFGGSDAVNHVQVEAAFLRAGRFVFVRPFALPSDQTPDWRGLLDDAAQYDLVLVTDPDDDIARRQNARVPARNLFSVEQVTRLSADPRFHKLMVLSACGVHIFTVLPDPVRLRVLMDMGQISPRGLNFVP